MACTDSGGGSYTLLGQTGGNGFDYLVCGSAALQQSQQAGVGAIGNGIAAADTSYHQIGVTYNGSAEAFYLAETTDGSGTQARTITSAMSALGISEGGSNYANYTLVEIFVYTRILTGTEISEVQSYLHSRYGT
jgi:hypothetical protein